MLTAKKLQICLLLPIFLLTVKEIESKSINKPRIVGGVEAAKGEFPWLVALRLTELGKARAGINGPLDDICVGTIISTNPSKVATAAHCIKFLRPVDILIIAGAWNLSQQEPTQQIVPVFSKWIHPQYDEETSRNDLAILEVKDFDVNEWVAPIRLPPVQHNATGTCIIAGWGQTMTEPTSDRLRKASIPIVKSEKCIEAYPDLLDPTTQVCAGAEGGGVDACLYDTGGPLVCQDLGYPYYAGIVSWGELCAVAGYPGVYTKVSSYVNILQP